MKNRFPFKHNKNWIIIFIVLTVILIAGAVINGFTMASYIDANMGIILSISVFVLLALQMLVLTLFMFNCRYTLTERHLVIIFALVFKKVNYTDILLIREDKTNDLMLIYYKVIKKGEDFAAYQAVNICQSARLDFVEALRRKNSAIVYEDFDAMRGDGFNEYRNS